MAEIYLHLFHGRATTTEAMDDWGADGPVLGPFTFAQVTYGETLRCFKPDGREAWFDLRDGCVFYGGVWYGDFTLLSADALLKRVPEAFDEKKAKILREPVTPPGTSPATSDERWANDAIQFPRLLAELQGHLDDDAISSVAASMDLTEAEVEQLLERAMIAWERIKAETLPPRDEA